MSERSNETAYKVNNKLEPVRALASLAARVAFNFEVISLGMGNVASVSRENPAIFAYAPHCGHPDALAVRTALPKHLQPLFVALAARDHWYDNKLRNLLSQVFVNTAPITRRSNNPETVQQDIQDMVSLLNQGYSIAVAPEGSRNQKPIEDRTFKRGWTLAAMEGGFPVIPTTLIGFEGMWPKGGQLTRLTRPGIVIFGAPLNPSDFTSRAELTAAVQERILHDYISYSPEAQGDL
jgi:1-acyl-sn-glycerol-3-phosphate acyltransferase